MSDLIEFLNARLAEDEAAAIAAGGKAWRWQSGFGQECNDPTCPFGELISEGEDGVTVLMTVHGYDVHMGWQGAEQIARQNPARVLGEVAAKRGIIAMCTPGAQYPDWQGGYESAWEDALHHLAGAYCGHPDWREEWAV